MATDNPHGALHQQIADKLRSDIANGVLQPGTKLPSEAEIAAEWKTTRAIAAQGLRLLIDEGLIVPDQAQGNSVRPPQRIVYRPQAEFRKRPLSPEMESFITQLHEEGREVSQTINVKIVQPSRDVRERLQLNEGTPVVVRMRTRFVDGVAYNTNDSYFPFDLVKDTEIAAPVGMARGTNAVLMELGYEQVRALDEIHVRMPTPDETERLQLTAGTPVGVHICTGYTKEGRPVRTVINCLAGDRHIIAYERSKARVGTDVVIRSPLESEVGVVASLWEQAGAWLRERGAETDQTRQVLQEDQDGSAVGVGECYLVEDNGVPVASITVDGQADADFWARLGGT
ncbi:DNA-binding GntR family transcriptional regulator [Streptomyces sp. V4I8]|uniref:GntR family transcriptional regulator n=1 Tax=Streptomyces sp. V4I8 TaxID=3156469 RepID=UPI0035198C8C